MIDLSRGQVEKPAEVNCGRRDYEERSYAIADCDNRPQFAGNFSKQRDIAQSNLARRRASSRGFFDGFLLGGQMRLSEEYRPISIECREFRACSGQGRNAIRQRLVERINQQTGTMFTLNNFAHLRLRASSVAFLIVTALIAALLVGSCGAASNEALQSANFRWRRQSASETTPTPTTNAPASKIPAVNYTLVDELFNAVMEESEVAKKWHKMDKTMTDGR